MRPEPVSIKVHKNQGNTMEIVWKDGHQSTYTFDYLRNACPCENCIIARDEQHRAADQPPAPEPASLLPLYKPQIRPDKVERAGNYALHFAWNDGHSSGLYSWSYLREWCPCEECRAQRHSSDGLQYDIEHHP